MAEVVISKLEDYSSQMIYLNGDRSFQLSIGGRHCELYLWEEDGMSNCFYGLHPDGHWKKKAYRFNDRKDLENVLRSFKKEEEW